MPGKYAAKTEMNDPPLLTFGDWMHVMCCRKILAIPFHPSILNTNVQYVTRCARVCVGICEHVFGPVCVRVCVRVPECLCTTTIYASIFVCWSLFFSLLSLLLNHTLPTGIIVLYTLLLIISHGEVYVQFTWRHHRTYDSMIASNTHFLCTHTQRFVCICLAHAEWFTGDWEREG